MAAGRRVDELHINPHLVASAAYRAFKDIPDAQFATDLLHIDGLALVLKRGVAGDDEQGRQFGEVGNDVFRHAVGEIFLLRIAAQIVERQHGDRRLVG